MIHARPDYNRIQDPAGLIGADEPVFLIRAQDKSAPETLRFWADENIRNAGDPAASRLAEQWVDKMEEWQKTHGAKPADLLQSTMASPALNTSSVGSDFDDLLREDGTLEQCEKTANERGIMSPMNACHFRDHCRKLVQAPAPAVPEGDDFNGTTPHLIQCIESLVDMSDRGVLAPHGLCGHSRTLLLASANRLRQQAAPAVPATAVLAIFDDLRDALLSAHAKAHDAVYRAMLQSAGENP